MQGEVCCQSHVSHEAHSLGTTFRLVTYDVARPPTKGGHPIGRPRVIESCALDPGCKDPANLEGNGMDRNPTAFRTVTGVDPPSKAPDQAYESERHGRLPALERARCRAEDLKMSQTYGKRIARTS